MKILAYLKPLPGRGVCVCVCVRVGESVIGILLISITGTWRIDGGSLIEGWLSDRNEGQVVIQIFIMLYSLLVSRDTVADICADREFQNDI